MAVKRVLVAIDSFKGSFTSQEAYEVVRDTLSDGPFDVQGVSIADGGEGTSAAFLANDTVAQRMEAEVCNPLGQKIVAEYAFQPATHTAVIDSAAASGLQFVQDNEGDFADPWQASSAGTGEMIKAAIGAGAMKVVVGLGGTGVNDCGIGLLGALGAHFYSESGEELAAHAINLSYVARVDLKNLITANVELISCTDVDSPLTGPNGATKMFGPQKGVIAQQDEMEAAFKHFAAITDPVSLGQINGDGAAGGIGFALRVAGAKVQSGFDFIANTIGLSEKIRQADVVVTGEGRMDSQSFHGKVPVRIAEMAAQYHHPCIGLAGSVEASVADLQAVGFTTAFSIVQRVEPLDEALREGKINLSRLVNRLEPLLELI